MIVKDSTKNLNCFKSTWKYFADKGIYLILLNIIPALLMPFMLSPSRTMYILFEMDTVDSSSLGNLFLQMWNLPFSFWYIGIIGLVLAIITVAITFGVIDRHMRVGEFTVSPSRIKVRLNYNILTSLKFVLISVVALEFYNIVSTLLFFLWITVFPSHTTALVFSCITLVLMELSMIYTMSWFILWPPFMLHVGMKSGEALKRAWSGMAGRIVRTALAIVVVVVPFQAVMVITACFNLGDVCSTVLDGIAYAVIVPYYLTLMYNTFYDVTGTERMDIEATKNNIWSKK